MTNQPAPQAAVWIDGDPLMETIAATVHEHCEHSGSGLVIDDPRNIAAWAAAAMRTMPVVPVSSPPPDQTADRAAVLRHAADGFDRHAEQILDGVGNKAVFVAKALRDQAAVWREAAETLRRLAAEAQQPEGCRNCRGSGLDPRYNGEFACPDCCAENTEAREVLAKDDAAEAQQSDTETPCERPRCPHCHLPHQLDPDSGIPAVCASIRASLADADRRHAEGDHGSCVRVNCEVLRERDATPEPPVHKGGNADDCPACQADGLDTIGPPYECPGPEAAGEGD